VELVDVYPSTVDLVGAQGPPKGETLDGTSVGWVLRAESAEAEAALEEKGVAGKAAALSQFGRCPLTKDGKWITNTSEMWMSNWWDIKSRSYCELSS
jgi:hypothetical protein